MITFARLLLPLSSHLRRQLGFWHEPSVARMGVESQLLGHSREMAQFLQILSLLSSHRAAPWATRCNRCLWPVMAWAFTLRRLHLFCADHEHENSRQQEKEGAEKPYDAVIGKVDQLPGDNGPGDGGR